jgi:CRP-like cAMP-binding protein
MKYPPRSGLARKESEQLEGYAESAANEAEGTLFGLPIAEPLRHLIGHYPYPARLNEHHVRRLHASKKARTYQKGTLLFEQGQKPGGAYIVLDGRVKLSVNSPHGREMAVGFFGPGTILELASAILARPHISTAETLQPTTALFVPREQLIAEISSQPLAAWHMTQMVCEHCYFLLTKIATVELSESAQQKMARCLLGLIDNNSGYGGTHVKLNLSQEAIAQMVGLSRETVSRLLSRLRRKGVLDWTRSDFFIRDRRALEILADLPESGNGSRAADFFADDQGK